MNTIEIQYLETPYGKIVLGSYGAKLCLCDWLYRKMRTAIDARLTKYLEAVCVQRDNAVLQEVRRQLNEYFNYKRKIFDIPLCMAGTDFQQRVWTELLKIPYGQTANYSTIAERIGNKNGVRAVARANGANAISIIIPCHRIIGSNGDLVGYAGGLRAKEKLLKLENNLFQN